MPLTQQQNRLLIENINLTGTAVDLTGIPAWAKEINIHVENMSTNGTNSPLFRIGTNSTPDSTGYKYIAGLIRENNAAIGNAVNADGFKFSTLNAAADTLSAKINLKKYNGNSWAFNSNSLYENATVDGATYGCGFKALTGNLDIIRFLTVNGTDVFDSGTVHIEIL